MLSSIDSSAIFSYSSKTKRKESVTQHFQAQCGAVCWYSADEQWAGSNSSLQNIFNFYLLLNSICSVENRHPQRETLSAFSKCYNCTRNHLLFCQYSLCRSFENNKDSELLCCSLRSKSLEAPLLYSSHPCGGASHCGFPRSWWILPRRFPTALLRLQIAPKKMGSKVTI